MKRVLLSLLVLVCLLCNVSSLAALDILDTAIYANYAYVEDYQQESVLYQREANRKMYPASLTKVITVIVALEMIEDLDAKITITQQDIDTLFETNASAANLSVGETITYRDLIYGALLPSGADATRSLAFNLCGDQDTFVEKMNGLARQLGLENTHFVNTTGIHDSNHYTTAKDISVLLKYALKNKDFLEAFSTYTYKSSNELHTWKNSAITRSNASNVDVSNIIGCKSGYTEEASNCLASLVEIEGRQAIVIIGDSDADVKASAMIDTNTLINYCADTHQKVTLFYKGDIIKSERVAYGKIEFYDYKATKDVEIYVPTDYVDSDITYVYTTNPLEAPIKKGDTLGSLEIRYNKKTIYQTTFTSDKNIDKDMLEYMTSVAVDAIFPYGLSILLILIFILLCRYQPKKKK